MGLRRNELARINLTLSEEAAALIIQKSYRNSRSGRKPKPRKVKNVRSLSGIYSEENMKLVYVMITNMKLDKYKITIKDKLNDKTILNKREIRN